MLSTQTRSSTPHPRHDGGRARGRARGRLRSAGQSERAEPLSQQVCGVSFRRLPGRGHPLMSVSLACTALEGMLHTAF